MEGGVMETPFVVVEDLLSVFTVSVEIVVLDSWRRICVAVVTPFSACTVYILCRDDASRNARKAAFHFYLCHKEPPSLPNNIICALYHAWEKNGNIDRNL